MIRSLVVIALPALLLTAQVNAAVRQPAKHIAVSTQHTGWMSRSANPTHAWLYVNGNPDLIEIYDLDAFGIPKIGSITTGVDNPECMTLDAKGNLYLANFNGSVVMYPPGATSPSVTLTQGLPGPFCVAVDGHGNLWVNNNSPNPSILIFAPGQMQPFETITGSLIQSPTDSFFDPAGNYYFADDLTGLNEIPSGSFQPVSAGLHELTSASGATMTNDGAIFAANFSGQGRKILVYRRGKLDPEQRTVDFSGNADYMTHGTVKRIDYVFLPNRFSNTVSVFKVRATEPTVVFQTDISGTNGVAYKAKGVP